MIDILLVEDSLADVELATEVLAEAKLTTGLTVARDGEEAMRYLRAHDGRPPRPQLILLDLNLPRKDGREVLREIKADEDLRPIPVVVLSSSAAERDVRFAYDHCANAYIMKPVTFQQYVDAIERMKAFWLEVARLPQA